MWHSFLMIMTVFFTVSTSQVYAGNQDLTPPPIPEPGMRVMGCTDTSSWPFCGTRITADIPNAGDYDYHLIMKKRLRTLFLAIIYGY